MFLVPQNRIGLLCYNDFIQMSEGCRVKHMVFLNIYNEHSRCRWIIFGPYSDELVKMMSPQNGRISSKIIKVIHDNCHKQVKHEEGAQEDKGDKVSVSKVRSTISSVCIC